MQTFDPSNEAMCAEFRKISDQADLPYRAHFGVTPPEPRVIETLPEYRTRITQNLASVTSLAKTDLCHIAKDDSLLARYEARVLSEAMDTAHKLPYLTSYETTDRSGRVATEFIGAKRSWMGHFQPQSSERLEGVFVGGVRMHF